MLDSVTKRRINDARDILVGKIPDPKSQVEQITIALVYKFMDDMDQQAIEMGGKATFFSGDYAKYAWNYIFNPRLSGHEMLGLYADAVRMMNLNPHLPQFFRDVFRNAYLPFNDPETLKLFLKTINEFSYSHSEDLGNAFEYLLSVLGSQGDAGQFRTPRHLIDFMVQMVKPQKNETVLDPACGTAGFLISAYKYILAENRKLRPGDLLTPDERKRLLSNFSGYDISPDMVRLSLVNMFLHGFQQPQIYEYDTLTSTERWDSYADVILANPPFMSPKGGIKPHKRFSVQSNRSEILFVDYMAEHLTPTGRAAIIVPEGIIFQSNNAYKQLRKMLVEKNYLWAVVSLPAGVFQPYSGVKTSILFLDRELAKKTDQILFVKVEADGYDLGAQRKPISKNDLPGALSAMEDWQNAVREGKEFIIDRAIRSCDVVAVDKEKLANNGDFNLSVDRYREIVSQIEHKWPMVPLGDICEIIGGGTPSKSNGDYWTNGTVKWISSKFINDRMEIIGNEFITEKAVKESSTRIAPKGSIILITRVSVGKYALTNHDYAINQDLTALVPSDNVLINEYLFLTSRRLAQQIEKNAQGIGVKGVTRDFVQKLMIPVPPLEVQREIVEEIAGYQRIIDGARQVVEGWKPDIFFELAKSMPKDVEYWDSVKLSNICDLVSGQHIEKDKYSSIQNGTPYITGPSDFGDIYPIISKWTNDPKVMANKNDILITVKGSGVGKINILSSDNVCISRQLMAIRSKSVEYLFLYYWLLSQQDYLHSKGDGAAIPGITREDILNLHLPLPSIEIQREIVERLNQERQIVAGNRKLIQIYEEKIQKVIERVWEE